MRKDNSRGEKNWSIAVYQQWTTGDFNGLNTENGIKVGFTKLGNTNSGNEFIMVLNTTETPRRRFHIL